MTTSSTPRSQFYGRVARRLLAFAGAGILYVTLPTARDLPNAPALAQYEYATPSDWGMTREDTLKHPYVARLAMQLTSVDYAMTHGQSLDLAYGDKWAMDESLFRALTETGTGNRAFMVTECEGPDGKERLTSMMAQRAAPAGALHDVLWPGVGQETISLVERDGKTATQTATTLPVWHIPTFHVVQGEADRRAALERLFPELNTDCRAAVNPTATITDVVAQLADFVVLKAWEDPAFTMPATIQLTALGAGKATVVRLLHNPPGPQVGVLAVATTTKDTIALENAFNAVTKQLSSTLVARHVGRQHGDKGRSGYFNYGLKDGFFEVTFTQEAGVAWLHLNWSKNGASPAPGTVAP